jgi:hypothetical protein
MTEENKKSDIQLIKLITDCKKDHDILKENIIELTLEYDKIKDSINEKLNVLELIEKHYVELIEELIKSEDGSTNITEN